MPKSWLPIPYYANYSRARGNGALYGLARIAGGASLEQARAELTAISRRLAQQFPETNRDRGVVLQTARAVADGNSRAPIFVLTAAVSCVLLLGCANLAGLLLTKAAGRKHEMAIRTSVGASRGRLMRQLLTECLLLSVFGGALGIGLAYGGMQLVIAYCGDLVRAVDLQINTTVLLYLIGASLTTGVLFGLAPALLARRESANALRQRGVGTANNGFRSALVAAQVALALVLLIGSGLMVKSMARMASIDPGFRGENVLTMEYRVPRNQYPQGTQQTRFHHEVIARVAALPGVKSAGPHRRSSVQRQPQYQPDHSAGPCPASARRTAAGANQSGHAFYFETLGIPLLAGRDFQLNDNADSARVAIVSQAFVTRFWPGQNPLGKQVKLAGQTLTVVGVAGNTKHDSLDDIDRAQLYQPYAQSPLHVCDLGRENQR